MTTTPPPVRARQSEPLTPAPGDTTGPTQEALLRAARAIGPLIREHADAAERDRRLSPAVVQALIDSGVQRMFTPRALGGHETDPLTCARVAEELALFDPAAAWALQTGVTGAWWCARLPTAGVDELFANGPTAPIAAAFHPPHPAREVPGGYRITGRGPLASTVHDAPWLLLTGIIHDGDRPRMTANGPEMVSLVMRTSEVEILDTWRSLGMRGTDSNDVEARDVFVPTSRAMPLVPQFEPEPRFRGPLYRLPAITATIAIIAPVALAIGRSAMDELRALAEAKTAFGTMSPLRSRTHVQATLAESEAMLRAARLLLHDSLSVVWQRVLAGDVATMRERADMLLAAAHAARTASVVTDRMHRLAGTSGIYERSRLERLFRDAQTVRQHGFVNETRFEAAGQVYLDAPVEFPFLGL